MDAKDLLKTMRQTIIKAKEQGLNSISMQNLDSWFSDIEEILDKSPPEVTPAQLEKYKGEMSAWLEGIKGQEAGKVEMLKATMEYGGAAIKSSLLINGGAAVALLAFIGKIWGPESKAPIQDLSCSLIIFVIGVAFSAMAMSAAYFSQAYYTKNNDKAGNTWRNVAAVLISFSYIIFFSGAYTAYKTFVQ